MKRVRIALSMFLVGIILVSSIVYADTAASKILSQENTKAEENENVVIIFALGHNEYFVNGELLTMDVSPTIVQSRTLLPIRYAAEPLGADVDWNQEDKNVKISLEETFIDLWIGESNAQINGNVIPIDPDNANVKPLIISNRTMLPLRFVAESLGCTVQWDPKTKRAAIIKIAPSSDIKEVPDVLENPESIRDIIKLPIGKTEIKLPGLQLSRRIMKPGEHLAIVSVSAEGSSRPSVKLSNGKTFYLQPDAEPIYERGWSKFKKTDLKPILDQAKLKPPTATVDLRKYQTSIKSQDGRNTCVSFAVCAAVEAAYKRFDPIKYSNLDLSEQYTHLIQKSQALKETPPSNPAYRENSLGRWGFANVHHVVAVYSRMLGIPEEKYLPYIGGSQYEKDPRDSSGSLEGNDSMLRQERVNNMNLNREALPDEALVNARYGVTQWGELSGNELTNLDYYRAILKSEKEIIFAIAIMKPDPTPNDNVWDPGNKYDESAHAMLMVGYDDDREVFIVKNSWGYNDVYEDGYTLMSYDWVTKGYVLAAIFINDIEKYPHINYRTYSYMFGQWNLISDGNRLGRLDVSHIPDYYQKDFPFDPKKFGTVDNRIGLLTVPDADNGTTWPDYYRVNGYISGSGGSFWLNLGKPSVNNYFEFIGNEYSTSVFTKHPELMAGYYVVGDKKYGFYGTKGEYLESVPQSTGNTIAFADFTGTWELNHDGEIGTLRLKQGQNILLGQVLGTYRKADGSIVDVTGYVSGNKLTLNIPFENDYVQKFEGYMHAGDKGLISGRNTYRYGTYFGWIARRIGDYTIQIDKLPGNNFVIPNLPRLPIN